jgi:hypothetical protein
MSHEQRRGARRARPAGRTAASAAVTALFCVDWTRCRVLPLLGTHVEKGRPDSRGLLAAVQGPLAFASLLTGSTRVLEFAGRRCHNARAEREREGVTVVMMMILYQSFRSAAVAIRVRSALAHGVKLSSARPGILFRHCCSAAQYVGPQTHGSAVRWRRLLGLFFVLDN